MTDAKPLSAEELREIRSWCESTDLNRPRWVSINDLLATIRRRDELIRWLNERYPVHFIADYAPGDYATGWVPTATDIQNAKEVLAIVEAGDDLRSR